MPAWSIDQHLPKRLGSRFAWQMPMRLTVWILGDQLLEKHPALLAAEKETRLSQLRVVLVESRRRTDRLPYQRKKLVLLFSAMRHYADLLRGQGYRVDYVQAGDMLEGLRRHAADFRPERIFCMAASEYQGRRFQERLAGYLDLPVSLLPNTQFLCGSFDPIPQPQPGRRYVMENFYRRMRRHYKLLVDPDGNPTGGQWNFDRENRRPLPQGVVPPGRLRFAPDDLTRQVMREVQEMEYGTGSVEEFDLAVTHQEARRALLDFLDRRLIDFGPYEDAMSSRSPDLFHSQLSPYLNLGLLEPLQVARMAEDRYRHSGAPIQSVEGFIRQLVGWREFMYWQYWRQMPELARANYWNAHRPLPGFFWNGNTDMSCLSHVIRRALEQGFTHHIERLMVASNFCLLAGISPKQVVEWFTACFTDAYEWVMLPNVLGMGLYADGGATATKPYFASANYIHKMSDYCEGCRYSHQQRLGEQACPFNYLYWNFLIRHEKLLRGNPRLGPSVLGVGRIGSDERHSIQQQSDGFLRGLD